MRAPAWRVSSEAAAGPRPQSSARPTTGAFLSRWNVFGRAPMCAHGSTNGSARRHGAKCVACTPMLGPLTLPPRLLMRALEDLNAIAGLVRSAPAAAAEALD